ncbi:hypothetical protein [Desulforamulus aquiferis]|uniref:Uncharacterized protein n=1 Tax=Desulforamulus aquiferis TaxID=1397668 RepID=A0AAW7ZAH1_9FIRM|nr:hypothetical protein [Desulforamulus aquiferis]MDO7786423.1 hypothetical protein [Desulforamulus aquiferis]
MDIMHAPFMMGSFFGLLGILWFLAGLAALIGVIRMTYITMPSIQEEVKVIRKKLSDLEERDRNRV